MSWLTLATLLLSLLTLLLVASCTSTAKPRPAELRPTEWRSGDGKVMPCTEWLPPSKKPPQAVVIAIHGLSGAKSDFWLLGERLADQGIAVHAFDLRGQGNDPAASQRGDIRSSDLWLRDLHSFHSLIQQRHPHSPIFWFGESLGSLIALHAAVDPRFPSPRALILASPAAGLRHPIPIGRRALLQLASRVMPRKRVRLGDLAGIDESTIQVTSTTTHGEQMTHTPHHVDSFSLRLLTVTGHLMQTAPRKAACWQRPLLMLASPHDVVASSEQISHLFDRVASSDKTLRWYERSHHLLLHDIERETVVQDVVTFLQRHLTPPVTP